MPPNGEQVGPPNNNFLPVNPGNYNRRARRRRRKDANTQMTWNKYKDTPIQTESRPIEESNLYQLSIKLLKVLTYLVTFLLVLGSSVLAKSMILLMTSQIRPNTHRPFCHYDERRKLEVEISLLERIQWVWALLFCFLVPEIFTFVSSLRMTIFKEYARPNLAQFLIPCTFEILHVIGLALLTFCILPFEHVLSGAMLSNSVCLLPAIFGLLCRLKFAKKCTRSYIMLRVVDGFAIISQILCFVMWQFHGTSGKFSWLFPISAILTSFGWWENYVSKDSGIEFIRKLANLQTQLSKTRHQSYLYISIIKMVTFFATMCLSIWIIGDDPFDYFHHFDASFTTHPLQVSHVTDTLANGVTLPSSILPVDNDGGILQKKFKIGSHESPTVHIILIQFLAAYLCSICAKFACRICIQRFSFALPLSLSVPTTIAFLTMMCGMRGENVCFAQKLLPPYLYWICPQGSFDTDFLAGDHGWGWVLLVLSQTWIVHHVWYPRANLLQPDEVLFRRPMGYNAVLTDQDLLMNRKCHDLDGDDEKKENDQNLVQVDANPDQSRRDRTIHINACATMWHETQEEMLSMLKSIYRLDKDQGSRSRDDPDYYDLEVNIFFDDAFKYHDPINKKPPYLLNDHVKTFVEAIGMACTLIYQNGRLKPFKKISTPYGGRLEWTLPSGTRLLVHLKNKNKIRHKKRWSQVMYMYYLLAHKIGDRGFSKEREEVISKNTFLLALDGDIDFQPEAVKLLVHRMRINDKLGAACGRIHPIGSGLMVWFQKFEYAIGHWLQKATEHMIGCVLCAPGCFSLFRASALMHEGVMRAYAKKSDKARDYVQYDQGEDRWLCTLLLQMGWRIDYCAASNALTHSPGGFDEFFNQRRRWIPSTMANIMDLLQSYSDTVRNNPDISRIYIFYQLVMMIGSILGPGTIFLMLVGAFVAAFKIDNYKSFYINFTPLILFILVCYFCKAKTQLAFAKILSAIYALIMVAVLIALILQMYDDGLLAPSSMFLLGITASFIIAGFAHPLEISCLFHGFVYFLTIPSMYLLLIIFSLFNLNDVSWGTRDDGGQKEVKNRRKKNGSIRDALQGIISTGGGEDEEDDEDAGSTLHVNLGALCQMYCCLLPGHDPQTLGRRRGVSGNSDQQQSPPVAAGGVEKHPAKIKRKEPPWIWNEVPIWFDEAEGLELAGVDFITRVEALFWRQLIKKFLTPIPELSEDEEKKRKKELMELRNMTVGAFFMLNAVFVTALFLMQLSKDKLFVMWPLAGSHHLGYQKEHVRVTVDTDFLHLEALGLLFVGFYAIILAVQFLGMLCHRFETFSIIMTSIQILPLWTTKSNNNSDPDVEMKEVLVVVDMESSPSDCESEDESDDETLWVMDTRAQFYRETMEPPVQHDGRPIIMTPNLMQARPSIVFAMGHKGGMDQGGPNLNSEGEDILPPYTI